MSSEFIIGLAGQAVYTVLKVSAPMLILGLAVGLLVSIFQATTQIQEQTLAFVPKSSPFWSRYCCLAPGS
ncbi:hypothetical protein HMSSN036_77860 [Paenibacillus macerans]|nr:hypothetical protein HMSSN036_77860 [Paenibacillus macerans]